MKEWYADIRRRYALLLQALTGAFSVTLDQPDPTAPAQRGALLGRCSQAGETFLAQFSDDVEQAVELAVKHGIAAAGASEKLSHEHAAELGAHGDAVRDELCMKMRGVIASNIAQVAGELRQVALATSLLQNTSGVTRFGALLKTRMNRVAGLQFKIADRAGRKWSAPDYVTATVGGALLQLYVDTFVYCCAAQGDTHARIIYADAMHPYHGVVFALAPDGDTPHYAALRDSVWHPNSTAGVERVHP